MHLIQELLKEAGYDSRSYSGRGMYGKTCLGVSSCHSESQILKELISILVGDKSLDKEQLSARLIQLTESFGGPATDSMGLDTIYYWPGIGYDGTDDEDDDLEDEYPDWEDDE